MTLEPEILCSECSHIDYAEHVRLARLHVNTQVLGFVHQGRVWNRLSTGWIGIADKPTEQTWHLIMVPIREGQHQFLIVLVFVRRVRVRNDQGPSKSVWILSRIMGVVPVGPRLIDLMTVRRGLQEMVEAAYLEFVNERSSDGDRALGNANRSIHMGSAIMIQTVEMQTRRLVAQVVLDVDDKLIPNSRSDLGYRPLPVDADSWAREAIRLSGHPSNVEVISHSLSERGRQQEEQSHRDRSCRLRCHDDAEQEEIKERCTESLWQGERGEQEVGHLMLFRLKDL